MPLNLNHLIGIVRMQDQPPLQIFLHVEPVPLVIVRSSFSKSEGYSKTSEHPPFVNCLNCLYYIYLYTFSQATQINIPALLAIYPVNPSESHNRFANIVPE